MGHENLLASDLYFKDSFGKDIRESELLYSFSDKIYVDFKDVLVINLLDQATMLLPLRLKIVTAEDLITNIDYGYIKDLKFNKALDEFDLKEFLVPVHLHSRLQLTDKILDYVPKGPSSNQNIEIILSRYVDQD
jgi:hypothetical protein